MRKHFLRTGRSAGFARERMKLLLLSDRLECTPQMMKMLRRDLIHTLRKYVPIEEEQITIQTIQEPPELLARIPLKNQRK